MALTTLNSHRPRRRDATRLNKSRARPASRNRNCAPKVASTNKAIANKAKNRDHAVICCTRASAKPSRRLASRKPCSQPKRRADSEAICPARATWFESKYHTSHSPAALRARLIPTHKVCGLLAQYKTRPTLRCRAVETKRRLCNCRHAPPRYTFVLLLTRIRSSVSNTSKRSHNLTSAKPLSAVTRQRRRPMTLRTRRKTRLMTAIS